MVLGLNNISRSTFRCLCLPSRLYKCIASTSGKRDTRAATRESSRESRVKRHQATGMVTTMALIAGKPDKRTQIETSTLPDRDPCPPCILEISFRGVHIFGCRTDASASLSSGGAVSGNGSWWARCTASMVTPRPGRREAPRTAWLEIRAGVVCGRNLAPRELPISSLLSTPRVPVPCTSCASHPAWVHQVLSDLGLNDSLRVIPVVESRRGNDTRATAAS